MPAKKKSLDAIVEEIDRQMDFARWWSKEGSRLDYAVGEKADPEVSKFAYRFVVERPVDRTNRGWQKPAAEKYVSALRGSWKIEAVTDTDCEKSGPGLFSIAFFNFFPSVSFVLMIFGKMAWQVEFVKRLPKEPYTKDGDFAREQQLIDSLRKLASDLRAEESDIVSTLVTNIARELNYTEWRRVTKIRRDREKGSPAVERFILRFSSKN